MESDNASVSDAVRRRLDRAVAEGGSQPICVGAIPFDTTAPARLFVPKTVERNEQRSVLAPTNEADTPQCVPRRVLSDGPSFCRAVDRALGLLDAGELRKVVLARRARYYFSSPIRPLAIAERLIHQNPRGLTFALQLADGSHTHGGAKSGWLVGSSPELLIERTGRYVLTNPLAGTARRGKSASEDREIKDKLLRSSKDRLEHSLVVDAIRAALGPHCLSLSIPLEPSIVETPTLFHLSTLIVGEVVNPRLSSLDLALLLHPTPAVCGTPTDRARKWVHELEDFDRGFFTGLVGYCDHTGDGRWAVSLRCGELRDRTATLFAGAGIVPGSIAENELAETQAKLHPMLAALGVPTAWRTL